MKTAVKLEETENQRRLHIGSIFVDLNESDYQELIKIFSQFKPEGETLLEEEITKQASIESENWMETSSVCSVNQAFQEGFITAFLFMRDENKVKLLTPNSKGGEAWISVEERLPKFTLHENNTSECVLGVVRYGTAEYVDKVYMHKKHGDQENIWLDSDYERAKVTHWMPLPEAPKQSNK